MSLQRRGKLSIPNMYSMEARGGGGKYAVFDNFQDSDMTLNLHKPEIAPSGATWSNNKLEIQSKVLHLGSGEKNQFAVIESGISDCRIAANVSNNPDGVFTSSYLYRSGIIARYKDAGNYLKLGYHITGGLTLYRVESGVSVALKNIPYSGSAANIYGIWLEMRGEEITFSIESESTQTVSGEAFNKTYTQHGIALSRTGFGAMATLFSVER